MARLAVRNKNRRERSSAVTSSANGSGRPTAANRFSADVRLAALVRGVTTSTTCGASITRARRRSSARRMDHSVGRCRLRGQLGQLTWRCGRESVLERTGLDAQRQARAAREQQPLALVGAEQILALV